MVPTLLGATFLIFLITRIVPGGPIEQMIVRAQQGGEGGALGSRQGAIEIPQSVMQELRRYYRLDMPAWKAYALWLGDVARLDLGKSYKYATPVLDVIVSRFPVSVYFGFVGFALGYAVSIPLGVYKAIRHAGTFDAVSSAIIFAGYSIPGWALGAILIVYFGGGSFWSIIPLGGFRSPGWDGFTISHKITDQLHHTIAPMLCYAVGSFATLTVLMKNSLMENLGQDYVRTAYAKGLPGRRVIFRHALRNSLIPICTGLGHAISLVLAGSYLIERVFNIDGIGYLAYTSITERDYTVVMGYLAISTFLTLAGNVLSDLLYVVVDPRIRFS